MREPVVVLHSDEFVRDPYHTCKENNSFSDKTDGGNGKSRSTNFETLDVTPVNLHFVAVYVIVGAAVFLERFVEHTLNQQQLFTVLKSISTTAALRCDSER